MGKSSSSRRKKRSKDSLKVRTRKSKVKSRKFKSKKLLHHDDSSSSSVSVSSSYDDKCRIKRAQSRSRKAAKGSKKRSKRRSYSSDTSEDSSRMRKRRKSKKNHDHEDKKKGHPKKKQRRDPSISSTNSDSRSVSMSIHETEHKKNKARHAIEEIDERNLERVKGGSKRSRYRSRSHSSCSQYSESSEYFSNDKVSEDSSLKSSRRLRSVITIVEKDEDGRELNRDEDKEEIIHFQDDYPSYRSNDSNDGESKREEDHNLHDAYEHSLMLENDKWDETVVLNVNITKPEDVNKVSERDSEGIRGGNHAIRDKHIDELRTMHPVNEKTDEVAGVAGSPKCDDLESLLRHQALENLKRFKGGRNVKQSSSAKDESPQTKHPKEEDSRVHVKSIGKDGAEVVSSTKISSVKETQAPAFKRHARDTRNCSHESVFAKEARCPTDQTTGSSNPNIEVNLRARAVQSEPSHSLKTCSTMNQEPTSTSQEPPQAKSLVTDTSSDKTLKVRARTMIGTSGNDNAASDKDSACGSTAPGSYATSKSTLLEKRSDNPQDEAKDVSQLEEKTMSVMRGGEMVQVSYKVYIPKKTPALARRQLKR